MNRIESGVITNKWYQSRAVFHNSWLPFCFPVHCQTAPSVCQWSRMQCMCYSICLSLFSVCMQYLTLILILLCAATSSFLLDFWVSPCYWMLHWRLHLAQYRCAAKPIFNILFSLVRLHTKIAINPTKIPIGCRSFVVKPEQCVEAWMVKVERCEGCTLHGEIVQWETACVKPEEPEL